MAILDILHFPDSRLRTKAQPVTQVDDTVLTLIDDMLETMYAAPGIGLAATQVNVHKQVLVTDVSENRDSPLCLINPEIVESWGEEEMEEGCLSIPESYERVQRAESIRVRYLDREGKSQELTTSDLQAVVIQHEMDHLKGKLFVDYISPLKRNRIRKRLEKMAKNGDLPAYSKASSKIA